MKSYDLYGISGRDIEAVRTELESALGIRMAAHESMYLGEYYAWQPLKSDNIILQQNYNSAMEEWMEEAHQEKELLIYVNAQPEPEKIEALIMPNIAGIKLLRRQKM